MISPEALKHSLLHFGPMFGSLIVVAWIFWRSGQLEQSRHAAELPLEVGKLPPEAPAPARRFPIVMIVMAILLGIGIGVPVATTAVALSLHDPGAAVTVQEDSHH